MIESVNNLNVDDHPKLVEYRETMQRILSSIFPHMDQRDLLEGLNYSINKRLYNYDISVHNSYTDKKVNMTMLDMCDYIARKEPIITSYGVLFKKHDQVPNPMGQVIQSFLDLRKVHKKEMFKYPKGSEMFEHYNLLQALDKIDVNGKNYIAHLGSKDLSGTSKKLLGSLKANMPYILYKERNQK